MSEHKWKFLTETYQVPKCTHTIDIPLNVHLLVLRVSGLQYKDTVELVADGDHVLYNGLGDFNNGYIFCDIDLTAFQDVRIRIEVAGKRARIRADVFGKWL